MWTNFIFILLNASFLNSLVMLVLLDCGGGSIMASDKIVGKKHNEKGIWRSYFKLIFKPKLPWFWIIAVIIADLIGATLSLVFPQYTQKIMAGVLTNSVIFGAVAVIVGQVIMSGIIRYMSNLTIYKIDISYRSLIWNRLMNSPMALYDNVRPTEMVSRITTDATTISQIVGSLIPGGIANTYGIAGTVVILFTYDWRLGMSVLVYVPVFLIINIYYGKWNYRANKTAYNRLSKLTQFLSELLMSVPLIKTFVTETKEDLRGKDNLQYYYKASMKRAIIHWIENPLSGFLDILQEIFVIGFGVYLVSTGAITIDEWIAFFMYIGMLWGMLYWYVFLYMRLKSSQGATDRIAVLVDTPLEEYEREEAITSLTNDITFADVSFSYDEEPVFKDLNFTIPRGKVTAIVGPSGSGKTTIFALLQQFYQPKKGKILLGNTSISSFHLDDWRGLFGIVAQDSPLISGTIRENIAYGTNREVTEDEIIEAARKANALDFILAYKLGFDTNVGEGGSSLSGGQRQRIAIARALLRNSDVLLLDEATASLDSQSEKAVQDAMSTLMKDRTTVLISHDLSNIQDADQIILLDSGKVDGIGTHQELMKSNELYRLFVQFHTDSSAG